MAAPGDVQERLDQIAKMIAANLVAEVCTIYLMRAGRVLELFATEGLRDEAKHKTRLEVGHGLVGHIGAHARPLILSDAQKHPEFTYVRETGEEDFRSFMGVPILRAGHVIGVVSVQNRALRNYHEEEVETLQTIAMVLAELVGSGDPIPHVELHDLGGNATLASHIEGVSMGSGLAIGAAVIHEAPVVIRKFVADNPEEESERLRAALGSLHQSLDEIIADSDFVPGDEHLDILEAYRMFAHDRGWLSRIEEAIDTGLTAEAAVQREQEEIRARMAQVTDAYLRERFLDVIDLGNRLLNFLSGRGVSGTHEDTPMEIVVIARSLGLADLFHYPRGRLRGIVTEEGSPTSHLAIIANSLDLPFVGQAKGVLTTVDPGDMVIVDGNNGVVYVEPGEDVVQAFDERLEMEAQRQQIVSEVRGKPSVSRDGVNIKLLMNAGLPNEHEDIESVGADGIGLYRTEFAFMRYSEMPSVDIQAALYRGVLDQARNLPVIFRVLDVGSDKKIGPLKISREDNPAIGWRSLRILLDRPVVLRQQLRAMLRAAGGKTLYLLFPMVADVAELDSARALLDLEIAHARAKHLVLPEKIRVGSMFEVPALAWQLPALLSRVDFLAVGSNDLMQFMFASDRGNPKLVNRYDVLSPAFLSFINSLVGRCAEHGVELSVCGAAAGATTDAMALIGAGIRNLSMTAASIGPVKTMVRSLSVGPLSEYLSTLYELPDHSLRDRLNEYAVDHGIFL